MDTVRWKISVEGGPSDLKLINDVTDEWIVFSVFEHRLGIFDFLVIQSTRPTASAPTFVGFGESSPGIFDNEFPLEFVKSCCHVKEESALGCASVYVLREHL